MDGQLLERNLKANNISPDWMMGKLKTRTEITHRGSEEVGHRSRYHHSDSRRIWQDSENYYRRRRSYAVTHRTGLLQAGFLL